ncbi:MAG: hypothetical protein KatS3mg068_2131 [Candidatus Sericytochromatia bacterium]|nr:MAG: hypothetical protein KatS3mg068_2131 [Candidatus Sericytochromatia bacterium]
MFIKKILFLLVIFFTCINIKNCYALDLTIEECIKLSLEKNLDIKIEGYSNKISDLSYVKILDEFGFYNRSAT